MNKPNDYESFEEYVEAEASRLATAFHLLGWRLEGSTRVYIVKGTSPHIPDQEFVRYEDHLAAQRKEGSPEGANA